MIRKLKPLMKVNLMKAKDLTSLKEEYDLLMVL